MEVEGADPRLLSQFRPNGELRTAVDSHGVLSGGTRVCFEVGGVVLIRAVQPLVAAIVGEVDDALLNAGQAELVRHIGRDGIPIGEDVAKARSVAIGFGNGFMAS